MKRSNQGALLMTVMISLAIVGMIAGSVASLINFQRKSGIRQQLKLHSMTAAEAAIDYAYAYITNDANINGLDTSNWIPPNSAAPKPFVFPPSALSFLQNQNGLPASAGGADAISFSDIKVTVMPRPATQVRIYKDPATTPQTDPNRGQWVYEETITLVASVTSMQGGIKQTSYARKDINYNITNLFQHAVFFQGQLHLHRGFKVMGSVHTNGNLILNAHDGDHAIYNGFVAAGQRFYRGSITDNGGTGMNAFGLAAETANGDLDSTKFTTGESGTGSGTTFTPLSGGDIPIYVATPSAGNFQYRFVDQSTDSRLSLTAWQGAMTGFNGYLQDRFATVPVPIINPIGSIGYNMDPASPISNGPYFLIEPLLPATHPLRTAANSQKNNYRYNLSANASLVLRVEYAARNKGGWLVPNPNNDQTYQPVENGPLQYQALNPANYIVRAYAKPATMARVNDPGQRIPIPFPTDVIGRADYERAENSLANGFVTGGTLDGYDYAAGRVPPLIDIFGSEAGITAAVSPRLNTSPTPATPNNRDRDEAWHRYRIEPYQADSLNQPTTVYDSGRTAATLKSFVNDMGIPGTSTANFTATGNNPGTKKTTINNYSRSIPSDNFPANNSSTTGYVKYGLHDSRLGRGANLLTLDIGRLKEIMEADITTVAARFGAEAFAFRQAFNNGSPQWNGIIYVEFPTSTTVIYNDANPQSSVNPAPSTPPYASVYAHNMRNPWDPAYTDGATAGSYLDTFLFDYATVAVYPNTLNGAETRYPLRTSNTTAIGRTDQIVPIAQAFRNYPATVNSQTITDPFNAILALQVINAKQLPHVNTSKFDATAGNTLNSGFTLATNAPLYLIGSWNSDGNYTTGTNVTSTDPTKFATTDTGLATDTNNPEVPSAIFCDMFTVLSPGWATQTNYPNSPNGLTRRQNSFPGWNANSDTYRRVTWKDANERIEVSACIATGDFPVFEFFTHALEDFNLTNGTPCTPLVVKGAMVSMFTSEVQHIKQAYGRDATRDIQYYWNAHGAHCFPSPRFHQFLVNGNFPPGTPQALVPSQSNFQVIFKGDPLVNAAGF